MEPPDDLGRQIATLAGNLHAATARFIALIGEFDATEGHAAWGFGTCAQWLSWHCGIAPKTARDHVRVARGLRSMPAVAAAFSSGSLSYSKVRAITRISTQATEATLLEWAAHATAAQMEQIVRGVLASRGVDDPSARHDGRYLRFSDADDGSVTISGRLDPEDGTVLRTAVDALADQLRLSTVSTDPGSAEPLDGPSPFEQARADALVLLAETAVRAGPSPLDPDKRAAIVVHVDLGALVTQDGVTQDGRCELANGTPLHPSTARRLSCDGTLVPALASGGPPSIGRRSRVVPRGMRRALRLRDRTCRFPGCESRHVDAHHVRHWADGGHTSLENLIQLCRRHHRRVHEDGFTLHMTPTGPVFRRPDGQPLEPAALQGAHHAIADPAIDETTAVTHWDGRHPDYDIAVQGIRRLEGARP